MIRTLIPCGILAFLPVAALTAQETPFSDLDVFQVEYASDVQIAPDAGWVAYVRNSMSIMRDRREGRLWMVRADGTQQPSRMGSFASMSCGG